MKSFPPKSHSSWFDKSQYLYADQNVRCMNIRVYQAFLNQSQLLPNSGCNPKIYFNCLPHKFAPFKELIKRQG